MLQYTHIKNGFYNCSRRSKNSARIQITSNGDTLLKNWTSLPMNLTLIPAGAITLHIHAAKYDAVAHDNRLWFDVG